MRGQDEFVLLAREGLRAAEKTLPSDLQIVVIVTNHRGDWVGVAGNVGTERVIAMAASATAGGAS